MIIPKLRKIKFDLFEDGKNVIENNTKKYDFDFTCKEVFEKQYKQFFGNTKVRTYEDVCEFFKVDMEILEKFLIHASIPAIKLEKPFVAREAQSITNLIKAVDSEEFDTLINDNAKLLLPEVFESIETANENYFANKAALAEVDKILKTLECA